MTEAKVRDQAYIKQSNIHSVLRLLREAQPVSRKELTRLTEMSPTSITRIAGALLDRGLVLETHEKGLAGRGRRALPLTINPNGLYTLGFLVDRDRIRMCVYNFGGQVLHTAQCALPDERHPPEYIAESALALYHDTPRNTIRAPAHLRAVGVSVSGIVDHRTGVVEDSIQMRWRGIDLRGAFETAFGLPCRVENDAKAAIIGEKTRLGIDAETDTAYLYLAQSGIATAITSGGALVRGERNAAGEVAHISLSPSDILCECGQHGCLQLHLVEHYLVQRAQKIDPAVQSLEGILAAFRQQLAWAEVMVSDFRRHLTLVIALLDSFCNPAKIIICGSTLDQLVDLLDESALDAHVILANDFAGASVLGAAIIAMQHAVEERLAEEAS